jgi:glucose-6-phosphate isomerase
MANAATARRWIASALGEGAVPPHFAAVSTAIDRAAAFGIDGSRVFGFWDWVGGRYSVWSAIGLPLAIAIGARNFQAFLDGAHAMDEHFRTAPLERNMPVIMGLLGVWYRDVRGFATHAVVPYDQRLERFAAHLQQLDMESNGKRVTRTGRPVTRATGPVVWGEPGTNGQHAFFQLLHQGTEIVPVDFLIAAQGHEPDLAEHHDMLVASCLAQAEALAHGRSAEAVARAMREKGASEEEIARLVPHRTFPGNRPSNVLLYRRLDPFTLGQLIALYEHRVFVQGAVWDVNSFDQWGVELGKELAAGLLPVVRGEAEPDGRDASTAGLVRRIRLLRGK